MARVCSTIYLWVYFQWKQKLIRMPTLSSHDTNFVVTGGTADYRYGYRAGQQWWKNGIMAALGFQNYIESALEMKTLCLYCDNKRNYQTNIMFVLWSWIKLLYRTLWFYCDHKYNYSTKHIGIVIMNMYFNHKCNCWTVQNMYVCNAIQYCKILQ